ncbi:hypothetical protein [Georgenia faecalis]|uniref:PH domain-containing protein n=1 Tax=Georgenia faecalis TaxID=2483799 RepID=A0ABV9D771_9MICO|nr:hypothetical protein [Georgenia faecalis]
MEEEAVRRDGATPTVVGPPPITRAERWAMASFVLVASVSLWLKVTQGVTISTFPGLLYPALLVAYIGLRKFGRPRIELGGDELVVVGLRTRRVPYDDITAVRGDIPNHITWSGRLFVERRGDKPLRVPFLAMPIPELRDLIAERAGVE